MALRCSSSTDTSQPVLRPADPARPAAASSGAARQAAPRAGRRRADARWSPERQSGPQGREWREPRVVETLVEMAGTMTGGCEVVEFLHGVSVRSVELLDCEGAGLLLADADGALTYMASSSLRTDAIELLESETRQGPCFESWVTGLPVISENLEADRARWPVFVPLALEKGFASIHAVPMRAGGRMLGSLSLFRVRSGRVAAEDLPLAQGMADLAAVALLQERSLRESRGVVAQLRVALTSRVVIEQAKGVLAERAQIGVDVAFARLRAYARAQNRRLFDVASDLIDGRLDAAVLLYSRAGGRPPTGRRVPGTPGNVGRPTRPG